MQAQILPASSRYVLPNSGTWHNKLRKSETEGLLLEFSVEPH